MVPGDTGSVADQPLDRDDVNTILEALFDLRAMMTRVLAILEEEDEEEEEDQDDA
jgi:hypothetical protein